MRWCWRVLSLFLLLPDPAAATIHHVNADGTGDFLTVQAAVDAAASGDTIQVAPGHYDTEVNTDKHLHYLGAGAESSVLDGGYAHGIFRIHGGAGGSFEGLSFTRAAPINALDIPHGGEFSVRECIFEDNVDDYFGGAISIGLEGTLLISDCQFLNNYAPNTGGALLAIQNSEVDIEGCYFKGNWTNSGAGAIHAGDGGSVAVRNSIFVGNRSNVKAGAIYYTGALGEVVENTFVDNHAGEAGATVYSDGSGVYVYRNIFSSATGGRGLKYGGGPIAPHGCNLYWNNADGPIDGTWLDPESIVADPLFCDALSHNFYLYDISPAAPTNSPCGMLLGALPVACTGTGVEKNSWSQIKSLY